LIRPALLATLKADFKISVLQTGSGDCYNESLLTKTASAFIFASWAARYAGVPAYLIGRYLKIRMKSGFLSGRALVAARVRLDNVGRPQGHAPTKRFSRVPRSKP